MPTTRKIARAQTMQRLEMRVPTAHKAQLQRAAALRGVSLTEFVVAAATDAAVQTIQNHESIALSSHASSAFINALTRPLPANPRLSRAAQEYAERYDAR